MKIIKLVMGITIIASLISAPQVLAASSSDDICQGIGALSSDGQACSDNSNSDLNSVVSTILNILSLVVGVAAIIMIIIGGFRYVVSGGNDSSVSGAKNTIIYALVGLIVVALAQAIVHFVLHKAKAG